MTLQKIYLMTGFLILGSFMNLQCSQDVVSKEELKALNRQVQKEFADFFDRSNRLMALIEDRLQEDIAAEHPDDNRNFSKKVSNCLQENKDNLSLYVQKINEVIAELSDKKCSLNTILSLVQGNSFEYEKLEELTPTLAQFAGDQNKADNFLQKIKTKWQQLEFGFLPENVQNPVRRTLSTQVSLPAISNATLQLPFAGLSEGPVQNASSAQLLQTVTTQFASGSRYPAADILTPSRFYGLFLVVEIKKIKATSPEKDFTAEELVKNPTIKQFIDVQSCKTERTKNIIASARRFGIWNEETHTVGTEKLSDILAHKIDLSQNFDRRLFGKQLAAQLQKNGGNTQAQVIKDLIAKRYSQV